MIAATQCLLEAGYEPEIFVLTDRQCGLLEWAKLSGHQNILIPYLDKQRFSAAALDFFMGKNCQDVLLFYTRMVTSPLIDRLSICNIHPSLLPSFKGLNAVKQALEKSVKLFGATLHRVSEALDDGPILAQVAMPTSPSMELEQANRMSYLQKIWLTLLWVESLMEQGKSTPTVETVRNTIMISTREIADAGLKKAYLRYAKCLD